MGGLRAFIIGRPRHSPGQRRANQNYTLNCNEPDLCSFPSFGSEVEGYIREGGVIAS